MSRSCQRATSSRPATSVAAQHPGKTDEALGRDRVALVGHGRRALLALAERLLRLGDLGALQVPDFGGDRLDCGADGRAGVEVFGMAVTGDDLGRRDRLQPERRADVTPRPPGRCWSRCRRRPRACRRRCSREPRRSRVAVTVGLQAGESELGAEGRRLGVHPMRPPDHRCGGVLDGAPLQRRYRSSTATRRRSAALASVAQRAVSTTSDDVRPWCTQFPSGGPIGHLHDVDEGRDVVIGHLLALEDRLDEAGVDPRRPSAASERRARPGRRRARPRPRSRAARPRATRRSGTRRRRAPAISGSE